MKALQVFSLLIVFLPLSALAEHSADAENECYKIEGHADQRKCFEKRSAISQSALAKIEKSYQLALKNKYNDDPDNLPRIIQSFNEASKEFVSFRTKQCDFMAALSAGGNAANDLRLSCEIALNEQRTKLLASEQEKLTSNGTKNIP